MPALVGVRGRTTPVLHEKQRQAMAGAGEVRKFGIQGGERRIGGDALVERVDEVLEERRATDAFVQRDLVAHADRHAICGVPYSAAARLRSEPWLPELNNPGSTRRRPPTSPTAPSLPTRY